jgi:hypothetical protein
MKKSLTQRLLIGLKKGYNTPTLPVKILEIQKYPLIRILRFLGGISIFSILFILSKNYLNFPDFFFIYSFIL